MLYDDPQQAQSSEEAMPLEVEILTTDHEIRGMVYVSREIKEKRRLTDLLNDPSRRFLAVTDASLKSRSNPSTPRNYSFLQVHMDSIIMMHPSAESTVKSLDFSGESAEKLGQLREKMAE